jgi:hypothetical protein
MVVRLVNMLIIAILKSSRVCTVVDIIIVNNGLCSFSGKTNKEKK